FLHGMTGWIPGYGGGAARRALDGVHQRRVRLRIGRGGDRPDDGEQGGGEQCRETGNLHAYTFLDAFIDEQYYKLVGAASRVAGSRRSVRRSLARERYRRRTGHAPDGRL